MSSASPGSICHPAPAPTGEPQRAGGGDADLLDGLSGVDREYVRMMLTLDAKLQKAAEQSLSAARNSGALGPEEQRASDRGKRHAEAARARVEIHDDADRIWLVVRDDGHGGASLSSDGTGLAGVARRAARRRRSPRSRSMPGSSRHS